MLAWLYGVQSGETLNDTTMSVDACIALCLDRGSIPLTSIMRNQPVILRLKSLGITGFFIFTSSLDFKDCISLHIILHIKK